MLPRRTIRECTGTAGIMALCHLTEAWGRIWDVGRLRGIQGLWCFLCTPYIKQITAQHQEGGSKGDCDLRPNQTAGTTRQGTLSNLMPSSLLYPPLSSTLVYDIRSSLDPVGPPGSSKLSSEFSLAHTASECPGCGSMR